MVREHTTTTGDGGVPPVREEIRFAVVLNGGVSLATWMGGVALEIDRLTRREGPYDALLRLVGSSARVDVITGTSAGGINGAALALAQLNDAADLRGLRDLWAENGRMESLLRTPFKGAPASLLRGDEFFLPQLERALRSLVRDYDPVTAERRPMHLGITTTLLRGGRTVVSDALGQTLPQSIHAGLMTFRHLPHTPRDDFAATEIGETVRRLALAARSSAGFPVAFEPSFLPVGVDGGDRPDMRHVASWHEPGDGDQSRFGVDGGVMVNTPTVQAVRAIEELPASTLVRRMMLLVFPHAPVDAPVAPQSGDAPPTVTETLGAMFTAMRSEAGRTHIEALQDYNRSAANTRAGRADVLASLRREDGSSVADRVRELHDQLYPQYRDLRIRRSARDLADRVPAVPTWSYERVLRAAEDAQRLADRTASDLVPRIPYVWDDATWEADESQRSWPWGITTAHHVVDDVVDLVRRLGWVVAPDDAAAVNRAFAALSASKVTLSQARRELDDLWDHPALRTQQPDVAYWTARLDAYRDLYLGQRRGSPEVALAPVDDPVSLDFQYSYRAVDRLDFGGIAFDAVLRAADELLALRPVLERVGELSDDDAEVLLAWRELVASVGSEVPVDGTAEGTVGLPVPRGPRAAMATLLVRLDVVASCLTTGAEGGAGQAIELVQVSLQTDNHFQHRTPIGTDKLGGAKLARFAGFLKESWRVNDWTWGRLDASTMLCRAVLDPRRVARMVPGGPVADPVGAATTLVDGVVADLFPDGLPPELDDLVLDAIAEVATSVFAPPGTDLPPSLLRLADLFAHALAAAAAAEELPALAGSVLADQRDGAPGNSAGMRFVNDNGVLLDALRELEPLPRQPIPGTAPTPPVVDRDRAVRAGLGARSVRAFDRAGIGLEPISQEAAGDLMIRTGATAMAVGVTVLDSPRLGLKAIRPFTRVLRGAALAPYWLIRGLAGGGRIAQTLALAGLAFGAGMLGISLLSSPPAWLTLIGVGTLVGGLAYAALRTGSLVHGLVLGLPAVPLVVYAVARRAQEGAVDDDKVALPVAVLVALLVLGLYAMGSLPGLVRSPRAVATDLLTDAHRRRRAVWSVATVAAVVVLVAVVVVVVRWVDGLDVDIPLPVLLVVGVLVAAGWAWVTAYAADRGSRQFQVWTVGFADGRESIALERITAPAAVAAAWAAVYGWVGAAAAAVLIWQADVHDWCLLPDGGSSPGDWALAAIVWTVAAASVLLFAAVFVLPARAKQRFRKRLEDEVRRGVLRLGTDPTSGLMKRLAATGTTYRYLLDPRPGWVPVDGVPVRLADAVVLSQAGVRLSSALTAASAPD